MQHPPQSITTRYSRSLLCDGQNDDFAIIHVGIHPMTVSGRQVGVYYEAVLTTKKDAQEQTDHGATPVEAVENALRKHGVTFR